MSQYDRKLFIELKQKLDQYSIPSSFSVEDAPIIAKLINKLQSLSDSHLNKTLHDETREHTVEFLHVEQAYSAEVNALTRENNKFRRELWEAREEIEQLKVKLLDRLDTKLLKEIKDMSQVKILEAKDRREKQLMSELSQISYKYNELMQLIHENPQFERQYIKRLIKYKHNPPTLALHTQPNISHLSLPAQGNQLTIELHNRISLLQGKLITREEQILRLQSVLEQNHSYIYYRYEQQTRRQRELLLKEEIQTLKRQNGQLKKILQKNNIKRVKQSTVDRAGLIQEKYDQQFISKQIKSPLKNIGLKTAKQSQERDEKISENIKNRLKTEYASIQKVALNSQQKTRRDNPPQANLQIKGQYYQSGQAKQKNSKVKEEQSGEYSNKAKVHSISNSNNKPKQYKKPALNSKETTKMQPVQHRSKDKKTNQALTKLLQQKNARIAFLEQQLKRGPGRSTKIISTNNINNTNNPNNNLIFKTNNNEYININNISSNQENESRQRQNSYIENELAQAAKERQSLTLRVDHLERQRERGGQQRQGNGQLAASYEKLQQKLFDTQNILIKTNEQNVELQLRLNQYLLFHKSNPLPTKPDEQDPQHDMGIEQTKTELIYLRKEVRRLKIECEGYISERQVLYARLREMQYHLNKLTKQMRFFEHQTNIELKSQLVSLSSSVKQLQNQSQLHHPS